MWVRVFVHLYAAYSWAKIRDWEHEHEYICIYGVGIGAIVIATRRRHY